MHRSETIATTVVWLLAVAGPAAQEPPAAEAEPLTWAELAARPELWPQHCRVPGGMLFERHKTEEGRDYELVSLSADTAVILFPDGRYCGNVKVEYTRGLLEAANAAYAAMSPEQRALDLPAITQRADLWPDTVTLRRHIARKLADGSERVFEQGSTLDLGSFDGTWLKARHRDFDWTPPLEIFDTDFVARVRAALDDARRPSGHRVLRELRGKLVRVPTGKQASVDPKRPPDYVALYFSAGWCGPCQRFSPSLVQFYEQHRKLAGKRFEVIWISRDHSEREMQAYGREHEFPWLAVRWRNLREIPVAQAHDLGGIPVLVLLDRNGAVVADSYVGDEYKGADAVLAVLAERIASTK